MCCAVIASCVTAQRASSSSVWQCFIYLLAQLRNKTILVFL
jgi:hypothetical protein